MPRFLWCRRAPPPCGAERASALHYRQHRIPRCGSICAHRCMKCFLNVGYCDSVEKRGSLHFRSNVLITQMPKSDGAHVGNTTTYVHDQRGPIRAIVFSRVWPHSGRCRRPRSRWRPLHANPPIAHTAPPLPPACCQTGWPGTARGEPRNPAAEMFVYGDLGKAAKSALMCGSCRPLRRFRGLCLLGFCACRRCGPPWSSALQCGWRSRCAPVVCVGAGAFNRPVTLAESIWAAVLTVVCFFLSALWPSTLPLVDDPPLDAILWSGCRIGSSVVPSWVVGSFSPPHSPSPLLRLDWYHRQSC